MTYILTQLAGALGQAASQFKEVYYEISGWVWPFSLAAVPFWYASEYLRRASGYVDQFKVSLLAELDQIRQLFSWDTLRSYIREWLTDIEVAVDWFSDWFNNLLGAIDLWWLATQATVQGWINIAAAWLQSQVNSLGVQLAELQGVWDSFKAKLPLLEELFLWFKNWKAKVLAQFQTWFDERLPDIDSLINSRLKEWFPFYNDLVELWGDIQLFFSDPLQWAYNRLDEFFERFW